MENSFEILVQKDHITRSDWEALLSKVRSYCDDFMIEVAFDANVVEFFLYSEKDLSPLSTRLNNVILTPVDRSITPHKGKKIRLRLSSRCSVLDFKEKEEFKKHRLITNILITAKKFLTLRVYVVTVFLLNEKGDRYYSRYLTLANPLINFEFDFKNSIKVKKKSSPIPLKFDEAIRLFSYDKRDAVVEVSGFPYFYHQAYVPIGGFDFDKHGLIVGQTGVGKSKFIELFIKSIESATKKDEYAVVIIDPHASLYPHLENIPSPKANFDFVKSACELFPSLSEPKIATELTILLFKTLLKDQFNAKMERVLKYVLFTMYVTSSMSLPNVRRFLTEIEWRKEVLSKVGSEFFYLNQFFDTEFVELQTRFYEISIMPILVLIDELQFVPALSRVSSGNLENSLTNNFLTCFSFNRIYLGDKATKLISGLIIQQLFLLAQKQAIHKKIILIVDEVSIVENESLVYILSEARKFNLSLILSQQYLTQISDDLLKGILSNVYNYFVFKVSDENAKIVAKNLDISFADDVLLRQKEKGISEEDLKRNILVNLNPRECLVRLFANGKFYPSFKGKTVDV